MAVPSMKLLLMDIFNNVRKSNKTMSRKLCPLKFSNQKGNKTDFFPPKFIICLVK